MGSNGSVTDFCSVDWGLCLDLFFGEFRGTTVDLFPRFLRVALGISNEVFFGEFERYCAEGRWWIPSDVDLSPRRLAVTNKFHEFFFSLMWWVASCLRSGPIDRLILIAPCLFGFF